MRTLGTRLGLGVLVVWGAFTVSFVILYQIPGDSVATLLSGDGGTTYVGVEEEQRLRAEHGLDGSFLTQYLTKLGEYLRLDFGTSTKFGAPVTELLGASIGPTVRLTLVAMALSIVLGVGFAVLVAYSEKSRFARAARFLPAFGGSIPSFWIALILLQLFSFRIQWFPVAGTDGWRTLVLPALTIAVAYSAIIAQVAIDGIVRAKSELYVRTAVGKGLNGREVHLRHVVPSAMLPTVSVIGVNFGTLLTGAVISEVVFSRQGLGSLMQTAVLYRDLPLVQGTIVVIAVIFVVVNLITDAVYPLIDPRARRSS